MADDQGLIQIGATFNKSQLVAMFESAEGDSQAFIDKLGVIFDSGRASTQKAMAATSQAVYDMAAGLDPALVAVADQLRRVSNAHADVRRTAKAAQDVTADQTKTSRAYAAALQIEAQEREKLTLLEVEAGLVEERLATASHHAVTDVQATSAAIRSLEGNGGLRAVENFVAKTLGLGPLLKTIFPIVGAIAFADVLFNMGKSMVNVGLEYGELMQRASEKTGLAVETLSILHYAADVTGGSFEDMSKAVSKMEKTIAAASEGNKAASALLKSLGLDGADLAGRTDGAEIAFRQFAKTLADTHDPIRRVELATGLLGKSGAEQIPTIIELGKHWDTFAQKAADAGVAMSGSTAAQMTAADQRFKDMGQHIKGAELALSEGFSPALIHMLDVVSGGKPALDSFKNFGDFVARGMAAAAQGIYQVASGTEQLFSLAEGGTLTETGRKDLAAAKELAAQAQSFRDIANGKMKDKPITGIAGDLGDGDGGDGFGGTGGKPDKPGRKVDPDKEALKSIQEQYAELNAATANIKGHGLTAEDALAFWAPYLTTFKAQSDEAKKILEEVAKAQDGVHKQIVDGVKKIKEEQTRVEAEGDKAIPKGNEAATKMLAVMDEDITRSGAKWDGYFESIAKGREQAARTAEEIALTRVKLDEEAGVLTHVGAAQMTAALHANEHAAALKALRDELAKLNAEAKRDPLTGAATDPKQAKQIQDVQNQIAAETGKGQQQQGQDQKAVADAMAAPYLKAFGAIESGWMTAQEQMLRGNKNLAQSMKAMWSGIALDALQNIEKMAFGMARHALMSVAQNAAAKTSIAATDSAAASTSVSVDALAALKKMNHSAAVAAGKAWSAFADVPLIGPELGAVAAGATYAGVMALAAFEQGTMYVPRAGAAVLHPGEAVLGSPSAQVMRDAMSGKLAGGGGTTINLHTGGNTYHGGEGNFPQMLDKNSMALVSTIKSLDRRGHLDFMKRG